MLLSDRSLCIILFSLLIRIGAVAQRLERVTGNRELMGSNPAEAVWKLFSISFSPLNFANWKRLYFFSEETLPFLRCAIINRSEVKYFTKGVNV